MSSLFKYLAGVIISFITLTLNAQSDTTVKGVTVTNNDKTKPGKYVFKGESYAIIVGISKYPGIKPLSYADEDAILFSNFLQTPAGGSVKKENIFRLINEQATAEKFNVDAYGWMNRKKMKPGDRLYIYFSGHGDAMTKSLYYLLPYNCYPNNSDNIYPGTGNIDMHYLKAAFIEPNTSNGVEVFLIIDACRTNELPGGTKGQHLFSQNVQTIVEKNEGEVLLFSTGAGQVSIESSLIGGGHGLFTYCLIDGLSGLADREGDAADNDGEISLLEISSWVKSRVKNMAKQKFNTDQVPSYCCAVKDLQTVSVVDSATLNAWVYAKKLGELKNDENLFLAANNPARKANKKVSSGDPDLIELYNQFIQELKYGYLIKYTHAEKSKLLKEQSLNEESRASLVKFNLKSAEDLYNLMKSKWPNDDMTDEARYSLASAFIGSAQQKINLYLSGKDNIPWKNLSGEDEKTFIKDETESLGKITALSYGKLAVYLEKGIDLLKDNAELVKPLKSKLYFLKSRSYFETEKKDFIKAKHWINKALKLDTNAAYIYNTLGLIYREEGKTDSSFFYLKKTVEKAPRWAYPYNTMGTLYLQLHKYKDAEIKLRHALKLDSNYANAYLNLGDLYKMQKHYTKAEINYKKALSINPEHCFCLYQLGKLYKAMNKLKLSKDFEQQSRDCKNFKPLSRPFWIRPVNDAL